MHGYGVLQKTNQLGLSTHGQILNQKEERAGSQKASKLLKDSRKKLNNHKLYSR